MKTALAITARLQEKDDCGRYRVKLERITKHAIEFLLLVSALPLISSAQAAPDNVAASAAEMSAILSSHQVLQIVRKYSGGPRYGIDSIQHFAGGAGTYGIEINGCGIRVHVKSHRSGSGKVVADSVVAETEAICK
jgi:hypothetical protein